MTTPPASADDVALRLRCHVPAALLAALTEGAGGAHHRPLASFAYALRPSPTGCLRNPLPPGVEPPSSPRKHQNQPGDRPPHRYVRNLAAIGGLHQTIGHAESQGCRRSRSSGALDAHPARAGSPCHPHPKLTRTAWRSSYKRTPPERPPCRRFQWRASNAPHEVQSSAAISAIARPWLCRSSRRMLPTEVIRFSVLNRLFRGSSPTRRYYHT